MSTTSPRDGSLGDARMPLDSHAREARDANSSSLLEPPPALSQAESVDRSKLVSPTPTTSTSLTPPPSSQIPPPTKVVSRTPTPAMNNFLASPPATTTAHAGPQQSAVSGVVDPPTPAQVESASVEELRKMVCDLTLALSEARTSAAHYKLQFNMLQMESRETQNRMAVELDMAHREVDVLQAAEERRKHEHASPAQTAAEVNSAHALLNDMTAQCSQLQHENARLHEVVASMDRDLLHRTGEIDDKTAEIKRLRERIRQNRDHITGFLDNLSESSPRSLFGSTPPHHRTPHSHAAARPTIPRLARPAIHENNPGLEAILLADKVLSQEDPAPSTPRSTPLKPRGHTRGTQSLSSLPSTPSRRAVAPGPAVLSGAPTVLRTPPPHPHLSAILEPPLSAPQPQAHARIQAGPVGVGPAPTFSLAAAPAVVPERRRRGSSDSTITASSVEEGTESDEVPESRASMVATSMLRATPVERGGSARTSFQAINSVGGGGMIQGRIVGKVTKSVGGAQALPVKALGKAGDLSPEKRRLTSFGEPGQGSPTKRSRMDGVGLGIGLAGSPRK